MTKQEHGHLSDEEMKHLAEFTKLCIEDMQIHCEHIYHHFLMWQKFCMASGAMLKMFKKF